jgi:hypothetical protein
LQHHLWLTSNAKTLLCLIPNREWRAVNMLVTTTVYFLASRELYRLTMSLRGMLLPDDLGACLRNLAGLAAALAGAWLCGGLVKGVAVRAVAEGGGPGDAAWPVLLLSCALGLGLFGWLVLGPRNDQAKHGGDTQRFLDHAKDTARRSGLYSLGVVAAVVVVASVYFSERPQDPTAPDASAAFDPRKAAASAAAAALAASHAVEPRVPGEMAQPLLGLCILAISLVMLGTYDSYFGLPMAALKLFGGGGRAAEVTYAAAYQPLLDSLGVGPGLPLSPGGSGGSPTLALVNGAQDGGAGSPLGGGKAATGKEAGGGDGDDDDRAPLLGEKGGDNED